VGRVKGFFAPLLGSFLTPWGPLLLGALDASLIFFLPLAIDMVVIIMSARHRDLFWMYPLLAAIGSTIGSAITFAIGRLIGENGLKRFGSPARVDRVLRRVRDKGAVALAVPALIPPPFPFTLFVLTSGALDVDRWRFFGTLFLMRLLRFATESLLALAYGRAIIAWLRSEFMEHVITVFVILAIAGTAWSFYRVVHGSVPRARARSYS
jgi:membrane protein YqaA with SNARE-associated domain